MSWCSGGLVPFALLLIFLEAVGEDNPVFLMDSRAWSFKLNVFLNKNTDSSENYVYDAAGL